MEEGGGLRTVRDANASGVHIKDVGSSSELAMSTASDATIKEAKTTDVERRKARKERKAAKIATREAREKKKEEQRSKTRRREKKLEESQERRESREGQQELKSKRRMSMMHHLVSFLVARMMEMMMCHTMLQKIARR